jgi:glucose-1-phosphate cytidylyltransferase
MKVVLFCGGLGLRLREYSDRIPKPMVPIGYRPIIWHLMRYYAHWGHTEFILCLGHRADVIKEYFLNYNECLSNDFVLTGGGSKLELLSKDIENWKITFVDTGIEANVAQRLRAVRRYLGDDEEFLANYSDNLSDVPLPWLLDHFRQQNKIASFVSVKPAQTFHVVKSNPDGSVGGLYSVKDIDLWINGGFFCFKREIFDYIQDGDELVIETFRRLIAKNQLTTCHYDGFWAAMDTFKEKQILEDLYSKGDAPWEVWKTRPAKSA